MNKTISNNFSIKLITIMKKKGINQAELARMIDVADTTIYRYIKGLAKPRPLLLNRLAKVLDCSVTDF